MTNAVANATRMRLSYKPYTSNVILPGQPPTLAFDPGASGGQQLRRTSSSLNLQKANFTSGEIRPDLQVSDFRHGGRRVPGDIGGELSPLTFQDFFAAVVRGTWAAGPSKTQSDFGTLAATESSSKFTVSESTWAAQGFRVGMVFRPAGITGDNLGQNYLITALNGVDADVYPPPADMTAASSFTVAAPGRRVMAPQQGSVVIPKFLVEHYYEDVDISHEFLECRVGSAKVTINDKISTVSFSLLGRDLQRLDSGSNAPFLTSPAAPTTTTLVTSYGGVLMANGVPIAVVNNLDFTIDIKATGEDVAFQPWMPEIFTGPMAITGTIGGFFSDDVLAGLFDNETQFDIAVIATTADTTTADFVSFYFPRVKLSSNAFTNSGAAGVPFSTGFTAYLGLGPTGYDPTSVVIQDSLSA